MTIATLPTAVAAAPLEEVRLAQRALLNGLLPPDLAAPLTAILRDATGRIAEGKTPFQRHPVRQQLLLGPGVLDLARALNARDIRRVGQPHLAAPTRTRTRSFRADILTPTLRQQLIRLAWWEIDGSLPDDDAEVARMVRVAAPALETAPDAEVLLQLEELVAAVAEVDALAIGTLTCCEVMPLGTTNCGGRADSHVCGRLDQLLDQLVPITDKGPADAPAEPVANPLKGSDS